jgi:hypothetical protein
LAITGGAVVSQYIAGLTREVSAPRLAKYRSPGGADLDMAVNYLWNMTLAEAFHSSLAALEIGLRNSLHNALTVRYNTAYWFNHADFTSNRNLKKELKRANDRLGGTVPPVSDGRVIAELHFFYWTTVISRDYHRLLWNPNRAALLRTAFPHLSGTQFRRDLIHQRFNTIRIFRNRVMHHEPLLYGFAVRGQPIITLPTMHSYIVEAIGWVSPQLQASLALIDRFPQVHAHGRTTVAAQLKSYLGIP